MAAWPTWRSRTGSSWGSLRRASPRKVGVPVGLGSYATMGCSHGGQPAGYGAERVLCAAQPWTPVPPGSMSTVLFCKPQGPQSPRAPPKPPGEWWGQTERVGCCCRQKDVSGTA